MHDAPLILEDSTALGIGEEATVRPHPFRPEGWPAIHPGLKLRMLEGSCLVGTAEMIEIVSPRKKDLSAAQAMALLAPGRG